MTTDAPSAAKCLAISAPMPFEAPVTTATFPSSFFAMLNPFKISLYFCTNRYETHGKMLKYGKGYKGQKETSPAWAPSRLRPRQGPECRSTGVLGEGL